MNKPTAVSTGSIVVAFGLMTVAGYPLSFASWWVALVINYLLAALPNSLYDGPTAYIACPFALMALVAVIVATGSTIKGFIVSIGTYLSLRLFGYL